MSRITSSSDRVLVIGAGIAGLSIAGRLSQHFDVTVVEAEFQPGYHSSGRSAAVYHKPFENDIVHRLSLASERFFKAPPAGFGEVAASIDHLQLADADHKSSLELFFDKWSERCPWLEHVGGETIRRRVPLLSKSWIHGVIDSHSLTLNVHNLLDGFRRQLKENGGSGLYDHRLLDLDEHESGWRATFGNGEILEAEIVVNAAGAWVDDVARCAGVRPLGIQPKRRTGIRVDPSISVEGWPMCYFVNHGLYFKPEGRLLMASPVDATSSNPCDAQPDMLDVATTIDRLNRATTVEFERPLESWAGLRSFVADGVPVVGFDSDRDGFFWYAAFGGCGFQTAPAISELACAVICGEDLTEELGVSPEELAPQRLDKEVVPYK